MSARRPTREQVEDALALTEGYDGPGWRTVSVLDREVRALRADLGMEMGMRTAAVDEAETLRRQLWALLDADQLSDDDTVERLRAALAARAPRRGCTLACSEMHTFTAPCEAAPQPAVSDGDDLLARLAASVHDARTDMRDRPTGGAS